MKIRIIIFFVLILCIKNAYCQNVESKSINLIIFIDDKLFSSSQVSNEQLYILDDTKNVLDSMVFKYKLGDITVSQHGYKKLFLNQDSYVKACLKFHQFSPKQIVHSYEILIPIKYLFMEYMILRIYNYENKRNRKFFKKKNGYGFEIQCPLINTMLPRKRTPYFLKDYK